MDKIASISDNAKVAESSVTAVSNVVEISDFSASVSALSGAVLNNSDLNKQSAAIIDDNASAETVVVLIDNNHHEIVNDNSQQLLDNIISKNITKINNDVKSHDNGDLKSDNLNNESQTVNKNN